MQFDLDRNIDAAAQDVQAAINAAGGQLPKNLPNPPTYREGQSGRFADPDPGGAVRRAAADRGRRLRRELLAQQISQIAGVGAGLIGGAAEAARSACRSIPAKLAAMGLTLEDVRGVLVNATVERAEGHDRRRDQQLLPIYANDQLTKAAPYNNVIIAYRNGAPIRVSDIGRAVDGPENTRARRPGRTASAAIILLDLQAARRQRHRHGRARSRRRCRALRGGIPPSIKRRRRHRPHADHPRLGARRASSP